MSEAEPAACGDGDGGHDPTQNIRSFDSLVCSSGSNESTPVRGEACNGGRMSPSGGCPVLLCAVHGRPPVQPLGQAVRVVHRANISPPATVVSEHARADS